MNKLDVYQTLGVFMPGYFFSLGLYIILEKADIDIPLDVSSIGGSIALIVISYVVGQIVQAFGNGFEWLWRKVRPTPTVRVRKGDNKIIAESQRRELIEAMKQKVGLPEKDVTQLNEREWSSYVGSVASAVRQAEKMEQVDVFNAHYGMFRGLVAASFLLACICWSLLQGVVWISTITLVVFGLLALYRMDRFDKYYARELFRQFLQVTRQEKDSRNDGD